MNRKRTRTAKDVAEHLAGLGNFLGDVRDGENGNGAVNGDVLNEIPDYAARELGRPEGFNISDTERCLLKSVEQAFDNGVLNILSPMQRACFTEVIISGERYQDVAARHNVTVGTVETHVKRAAARIRKAIEG